MLLLPEIVKIFAKKVYKSLTTGAYSVILVPEVSNQALRVLTLIKNY